MRDGCEGYRGLMRGRCERVVNASAIDRNAIGIQTPVSEGEWM